MIMLTGRSDLPPGFDPGKARPSDWPSIAAVAGALTRPRNNLPPAVVLPERLVHNTGRVIPGQFAGEMGPQRDPWFIEASPFDPNAYGAYPEYEFDHQQRPQPRGQDQEVPGSQPDSARGLHGAPRWRSRLKLLEALDRQPEQRSRAWPRPRRSISTARRPSRC